MIKFNRYPDEEAGEVPMAYIVRRPESTLDEAQVMDYIAKQVIKSCCLRFLKTNFCSQNQEDQEKHK